MCQPANCSACGKPTYVGCGRHVEQVLGHVPKDQRCTCRETASEESKGRETSLIQRIFGR